VVQVFGGNVAAAAAALNQIVPQAGAGVGSGIPDTESEPLFRDSLSDGVAQPLQASPAGQSEGKEPQIVTPVLGGMLRRLNPPDTLRLPHGLTATTDDYSIWGNEARW